MKLKRICSKMLKTYFDKIKSPNPEKYKCRDFQLTKMPLNYTHTLNR